MMTDIPGASNAKASRELGWNAHPNLREGSRGRYSGDDTAVLTTTALAGPPIWVQDVPDPL